LNPYFLHSNTVTFSFFFTGLHEHDIGEDIAGVGQADIPDHPFKRVRRENLADFESHLKSPIPGTDDGGRWQYRYDKQTVDFDEMKEDESTSYVEFLINIIFLRAKYNISHLGIGKFMTLLSEFPLIPARVRNTLPTTYRSLMTFLEELGYKMSIELVYDICGICYFIYRGAHKNDANCPHCGARRFDDKNKPLRQLIYRPIRHWIERLFSCAPIAKDMDYHRKSGDEGPNGLKLKPTEVVDIYDGKAWKDAVDESFLLEPRHLRVGIVTDGVQVFRDNDQYSIWPIAITAYNLPPTKRYAIGPTTLLGILPGKNDKNVKMDLQPFIKLIGDELIFLNNDGWEVHDAHKGDSFVCKVRLIHVVSDLRGLEKVFDQPPVPSKFACLKCFVPGVRIPQGKTIYPGIARCLSNHSPLREVLLKKPIAEHMYVSPTAGPFPPKKKEDYIARLNELPIELKEVEDRALSTVVPSQNVAPPKQLSHRDGTTLISNIDEAGPSCEKRACGMGERLQISGASTCDLLPVPNLIGEEEDTMPPIAFDRDDDLIVDDDEEVLYEDEDANPGIGKILSI